MPGLDARRIRARRCARRSIVPRWRTPRSPRTRGLAQPDRDRPAARRWLEPGRSAPGSWSPRSASSARPRCFLARHSWPRRWPTAAGAGCGWTGPAGRRDHRRPRGGADPRPSSPCWPRCWITHRPGAVPAPAARRRGPPGPRGTGLPTCTSPSCGPSSARPGGNPHHPGRGIRPGMRTAGASGMQAHSRGSGHNGTKQIAGLPSDGNGNRYGVRGRAGRVSCARRDPRRRACRSRRTAAAGLPGPAGKRWRGVHRRPRMRWPL